jgi:hypothetical protein
VDERDLDALRARLIWLSTIEEPSERERNTCREAAEAIAALRARAEQAEAALRWYAEKAEAMARYSGAQPPQTDAMMAVVTELTLDAGRRAAGLK